MSRPTADAQRFAAVSRDKIFRAVLRNLGIALPVTELSFAKPRLWRFDFAWPENKLALEVEGGVWVQGRHTRGEGYLADLEKYNYAVLHGWRVLRTTPDDLTSIPTAMMIRTALRGVVSA